MLALPLAAVPILLHFYKHSQREVIPWAAMLFLVEAMAKGRRMQRLEELLLLLLRVAAVSALVLALARPMLRGNWFSAVPTCEVVIVLDDSLSMSRQTEGESVFDDARRQAQQLIDDLGADALVQVVLAAEGPQWLTLEALPATASTRDKVKADLAALQPTRGAAALFACLQAIVGGTPAEGVTARRVVVFTDCQAHGWQAAAVPAWRSFRDVCEQSSIPTSVDVIECGPAEADMSNLAVMRLEVSPTIAGQGDSVALRAEVKNTSATACPATVLHWLCGKGPSGTTLDTSPVGELNPGEAQSLEFSWQPKTGGVFALGCQLKSVDALPMDALPMDDEEFAVCEVVDKIPVLIVGQTPKSQPILEGEPPWSDASFVATALGYRFSEQGESHPHEQWHSVFSPRRISAKTLETISLGQYRAVVIARLTPLPARVIERLRDFVTRGGGLWVALGRHTDCETFNAAWYDEGGGLCPLLLDTRTGEGDQAIVNIHPPSADHPATTQLADTQRLDIDQVRVRHRQRFVPPATGQKVSVLLATGTGEPLAIEHYVGRGRVIIQTIPLGIHGSNLAMTKAYVVMVHDWLAYLTQPAATRFNLPPHGQIEFTSSGELFGIDVEGAEVRIIGPAGDESRLALTDTDGETRHRFSRTAAPGLYTVRFSQDDQTLLQLPFNVARDAEESTLTALNTVERERLAEAAGFRFSRHGDNLDLRATEMPVEKPVWSVLLFALVVLILLELILATRSSRGRTAVAPSVS